MGGEDPKAKNDIASFIDRLGVSREANHAIRLLRRAWEGYAGRYELEIAGHLFPGRESWSLFWPPLFEALGPLRGKRVLEVGGEIPLFSAFAACCGAEVTYAPLDGRRSDRATRIFEAAGVEVELGLELSGSSFDLVVCLEADAMKILEEGSYLSGVSFESLVLEDSGDPERTAEFLTGFELGLDRLVSYSRSLNRVMLARRRLRAT
jgi:hypothetical protein